MSLRGVALSSLCPQADALARSDGTDHSALGFFGSLKSKIRGIFYCHSERRDAVIDPVAQVVTGDDGVKRVFAKSHGLSLRQFERVEQLASTIPMEHECSSISQEGREFIVIKADNGTREIGVVSEELGSGVFSTVYRVHTMSKKRLAFKKPKHAAGLQDMLREVEVLRVVHDKDEMAGVVPVPQVVYSAKGDKEVGALMTSYDGNYFMALSRDLRADALKSSRVVNKHRKIIGRIVDALASLHRVGIVHCDLKVENVFLTGDDDAVLGDFGFATVLERLRESMAARSDRPGERGSEYSVYHLDISRIYRAWDGGDFEGYKELRLKRDIYALGCSLSIFLVAGNSFYMESVRDLWRCEGLHPKIKDLVLNSDKPFDKLMTSLGIDEEHHETAKKALDNIIRLKKDYCFDNDRVIYVLESLLKINGRSLKTEPELLLEFYAANVPAGTTPEELEMVRRMVSPYPSKRPSMDEVQRVFPMVDHVDAHAA